MSALTDYQREALDVLTPRQQAFCRHMAAVANPAQAAKLAGYSNPKNQGGRCMKSPAVKEALRRLTEPRLVEADMTAERVIKQLHDFLFRDAADYFSPDGTLIGNVADLPPEARQCIEGWKVKRYINEETGDTEESIEVKLVPKSKALELAMKYHKLVGPDTEVNNINVGQINWNDFYNAAPRQAPTVDEAIAQRLGEDDA